MQITRVAYEACFNLGNYENEKIRIEATIAEGENSDDVIAALRDKVKTAALPSREDLFSEIYDAQKRLKDLNRLVEQKTEQWNSMAEFLRAQGIKADAVDMPVFERLLSPASEVVESIDSEIVF